MCRGPAKPAKFLGTRHDTHQCKRHCQLEPTYLADVMIRGDEPWLGRNVLVPVADSGGGRGRRRGDRVADREAVGHHLSVVGRRQQVPTGPKVRRVPLNADRNRCACRIDVKRFIARSRCRVGWWEFSARHCQVERSGRGRQSRQPHASHMTWGFTRTHRLKSWSDCST